MRSSHKKDEKRSVFDVHASQGKEYPSRSFFNRIFYGRNVINLRKKFRTRHPWIWGFALALVVLGIFVGIRKLSIKAEVQDFNPSTCLGTWQNPANAAGNPETMVSESVPFSADNSAVYASDTQIFCGGFFPQNFATSGAITNVGLTLVWQVGDAPTSSPPQTDGGVPAPTATSTDASSTVSSSVPIARTSTATDSTTTVVITTATDATTSASSSIPVASSNPAAAASTPVSGTESTAANDATTAAVTTTVTITTTSTPPAADSSTATTSLNPFRAFFARLITAAFADDGTTTASATTPSATGTNDQSSTIVSPPIFANLAPASSSTSTASSTGSSTPVVLPPLPPPDENFLDVSYSTDGQTWISVGEVNTANWQNFTVTLPIADWTDLQNLQVRIEGIPTTQDPVPPIYLDGMFLEAHYDLPPSIVNDLAGLAGIPATPAPTPVTTKPAPSASAPYVPPPPVKVVDSNAKQTCAISPFSQTGTGGGILYYDISFTPSYPNSPFSLSLGKLPNGVTSTIGTAKGTGMATSSLMLSIASTTGAGSFNGLVIYAETQPDGTTLSNFCQFNFVIRD